MLLKLYLLGAALALMPLPIQPQGPPHNVFFDGIPKNITNTTFPFQLNTVTNYDIVLVKCPYGEYRQNGENDDFKLERKLERSKIGELIFKDDVLIWTPSMRKSSSKVQHNCGKLTANIDGTSDRNIMWIYNIMWKNASTLPMSAELRYTKTDVKKKHNKCNNGNEEALILTKNKENGMIVKVNPAALENPYVNQIFHYFIKPKEDNINLIQEPCATVKIYQ